MSTLVQCEREIFQAIPSASVQKINCCRWSNSLIQCVWFLQKILKLANNNLMFHKKALISDKISHLFWKYKVKGEPEQMFTAKINNSLKVNCSSRHKELSTWLEPKNDANQISGSLYPESIIFDPLVRQCNWRAIIQAHQYEKNSCTTEALL